MWHHVETEVCETEAETAENKYVNEESNTEINVSTNECPAQGETVEEHENGKNYEGILNNENRTCYDEKG